MPASLASSLSATTRPAGSIRARDLRGTSAKRQNDEEKNDDSRFGLANRIGCWFNGLYLHLQLPSVSRTSSARMIVVSGACAKAIPYFIFRASLTLHVIRARYQIMQTILGPFHPDLENSLVEEILNYKEADLLARC